jgi:hypothetical protein
VIAFGGSSLNRRDREIGGEAVVAANCTENTKLKVSTMHHASLITGALVQTLFVYSLAIWIVVSPAAGQTAKSYKVAIEVPNRAPVSLHVEEQGTGRPIV